MSFSMEKWDQAWPIYLSPTQKKDKEHVSKLASALARQGYTVWWDQELIVGAAWRNKILQELKAAECVVVVWSRNSVVSDFVLDETERAKSKLIPIKIDNCDIPIGYGSFQTHLLPTEGALTPASLAAILQSVDRYVRTQSQSTKKGTVYLVDQNVIIAEAFSSVLEGRGYVIECFVSVAQAMRRILETPPDLVIMEANFHDHDGVEFIRALRRAERFRGLPILICAGDTSKSISVTDLDGGAVHFLPKPVTEDALVRRIEAIFGVEAKGVGARIIRLGSLSLDPTVKLAICDDDKLAISDIDFEVIAYLAQRPNQAVALDELFKFVSDAAPRLGYAMEELIESISLINETLKPHGTAVPTLHQIGGRVICVEPEPK